MQTHIDQCESSLIECNQSILKDINVKEVNIQRIIEPQGVRAASRA
jgi:hypothetical protein